MPVIGYQRQTGGSAPAPNGTPGTSAPPPPSGGGFSLGNKGLIGQIGLSVGATRNAGAGSGVIGGSAPGSGGSSSSSTGGSTGGGGSSSGGLGTPNPITIAQADYQQILSKIPTFQGAADWIRTRFLGALGSLNGWPFDPNLRTQFQASGSVLLNGAPVQGLQVVVILYAYSVVGAPTVGAPLATGKGTTDANGNYQITGLGSYDLRATNYLVEIDLTDGNSVTAWKRILVTGAQLWAQGIVYNWVVANQLSFSGTVTRDGGSGVGAYVTVNVYQLYPDGSQALQFSLGGWVAQDGTWSVYETGIFYDASSDANAKYGVWVLVYWGSSANNLLVDYRFLDLTGAQLAAQPSGIAFTLATKNGQISATDLPTRNPPPHHQRSP